MVLLIWENIKPFAITVFSSAKCNSLLKYLWLEFNEITFIKASQVVLGIKSLPANAEKVRDVGSLPGVGKIPWRRS